VAREVTEVKLSGRIAGALDTFDGAESISKPAFRRLIVAASRPVFEAEFKQAATATLLAFLSDDQVDADELSELAKEAASEQAATLGNQMADTTDDWVENGTHQDYAFSVERADAVAITEITRARTLGQMAAMQILEELGIKTLAVWITALDERVCPVCGPLHNQDERTWGKLFPMGTPAHVNCRCGLEVVERASRKKPIRRLRTPKRRQPGRRVGPIRFSRLSRTARRRTESVEIEPLQECRNPGCQCMAKLMESKPNTE
jgi:hypothetical protein